MNAPTKTKICTKLRLGVLVYVERESIGRRWQPWMKTVAATSISRIDVENDPSLAETEIRLCFDDGTEEVESGVGDPCLRCGLPEFIFTETIPEPVRMPNGEVNEFGRAHAAITKGLTHWHHECARSPEKILTWLLDRIGGWTNARWDQHLRNEFGDAATDELIKELANRGVKPSRGRR